MDIVFTNKDRTYIKNQLVKILESDFIDPNNIKIKIKNHSEFVLHIACREGWVDIIRLYVENDRVDLNKCNEMDSTIFPIACHEGHFDIVELLIDDHRVNTNVTYYDCTPLILSMKFEDQRIFNFLLESDR